MSKADEQPLPCRGCTADCPNRPYCDGKPWRQTQPAGTASADKKVKLY